MRRTTSAAFTRALSVRNGIEPWPGVPLTRIRRQYAPFSPTMTGSFGPPAEGSGIRNPPDSVITKSARTASGSFSTSQPAPWAPRASSSATAR